MGQQTTVHAGITHPGVTIGVARRGYPLPAYSPGVQLAWQIGASEAIAGHHAFIEPEHVLIGLCRLGEVAREDRVPPIVGSDQLLRYLQVEVLNLHACFAKYTVDVARFASGLRALAGEGRVGQVPSNEILPRNPACRDAFQRAAQLAREHGAPFVVFHAIPLTVSQALS